MALLEGLKIYYVTQEDVEKQKKVQKDIYLSQENAFIKYITQIDQIPEIVPTSFLKKYARRVLFSGKIKGLSFIQNPKTINLNSCMRNNISLCEDAGLDELADETVFDNIDICQITRGTKGNLQNALITQRKEFKDTSERNEKGFLSNVLHRKKKEDQGPQIQEAY